MARDSGAQRKRLLKRNEEVRGRYHALREVRDPKNNARKYTEEWIYRTLEMEFHLSMHSIQDIISHQYEKALERKQPNTGKQPTLFDNL